MRKVATIDGAGVIAVEEQPIPQPGRGEVLMEVNASLISPGTELGGVKAAREAPKSGSQSRVFGYQNAGTVLALGDDCEGFAEGQRVAAMGAGYALHTTHACVPKNLCTPLPDNVSFEEGAANHLAATALQAVRRADVSLGDTVAVAGLGVVGQFCVRLARLSGARVLALDRFPLRVALAKEMGADVAVNVSEQDPIPVAKELTRGYGTDASIIAFGGEATDCLRQLVEMTKLAPDGHHMGSVVIVGGAKISQSFPTILGNMDLRASSRTGPGYHDEPWERGDDYPPVFVQWSTRRNLDEVIRLMSEGRLPVQSIITHRYPLDQAPEACEKLIQQPEEAVGVLLLPHQS